MNFPDSNFWNYSLQIYGLPDVEQYCLTLQDTYGANINILLYCCWMAEQQCALDEQQISAIMSSSQDWQGRIVKPLREARRAMSEDVMLMPAELYQQTKDHLREMELNVEHMEQIHIEKALDTQQLKFSKDQSPADITTHNMSCYMKQLDSVDDTQTRESLVGEILTLIYGTADKAAENAGI